MSSRHKNKWRLVSVREMLSEFVQATNQPRLHRSRQFHPLKTNGEFTLNRVQIWSKGGAIYETSDTHDLCIVLLFVLHGKVH